LESRLEKLEQKLADVKHTKIVSDDDMTRDTEPKPSRSLNPAQKKEAEEMNELVSSFGLL